MKNLLRKNIKFAMLLSFASMMGLEASQCVVVPCPSYESVLNSEKLVKNTYVYSVTSESKDITFSGSTERRAVRPADGGHIEAQRLVGPFNGLNCIYVLQRGGLTISSNDATALRDCTVLGGASFNCKN